MFLDGDDLPIELSSEQKVAEQLVNKIGFDSLLGFFASGLELDIKISNYSEIKVLTFQNIDSFLDFIYALKRIYDAKIYKSKSDYIYRKKENIFKKIKYRGYNKELIEKIILYETIFEQLKNIILQLEPPRDVFEEMQDIIDSLHPTEEKNLTFVPETTMETEKYNSDEKIKKMTLY